MNFQRMIGLGVAGNFTGHLEQAGEAKDFVNIQVADHCQPKGLFPFYVPGYASSFLSTYPISSTHISYPQEGGNLQIEPEIAIICRLVYQEKKVHELHAVKFAASNNCSIRKPGARKISEKKNWGRHSKGLSQTLIEIDRFRFGGIMDQFHIASFLRREGQLHTYGIDSPALGYSYFYETLQAWIIDRMNAQLDEGPLESILELIEQANYPEYAIMSIGATRYTEFGECTYLQPGDESIVMVYDASMYMSEAIGQRLAIEPLLRKTPRIRAHCDALISIVREALQGIGETYWIIRRHTDSTSILTNQLGDPAGIVRHSR